MESYGELLQYLKNKYKKYKNTILYCITLLHTILYYNNIPIKYEEFSGFKMHDGRMNGFEVTIADKVVRNCVTCILAKKKSGKRDDILHPIKKCEVLSTVYDDERQNPVPSKTLKSDQRIGKKPWISQGKYRYRTECKIENSEKGPKVFSSSKQSSSACHLLADDSKSWTWDQGVFVLAFQVLALEIF
ncbi:hypothetical protein WN51_09952 [Melipona quadrifasciata]|uniref:Uncharacterized protein n=1 Tax=Melipona quadrifasciata TaxID=166423 RepID=A0A0M9ABB0_9HYME|nr:hypothetical protein WN51_09952 [Melipona quadrifasciata]